MLLAGIPPLVGFYAKLAVLQALVGAGRHAAVIAVVFSLMIGLAVIAVGVLADRRVLLPARGQVVYFDEPAADAAPMVASAGQRAVLSVNGLVGAGASRWP